MYSQKTSVVDKISHVFITWKTTVFVWKRGFSGPPRLSLSSFPFAVLWLLLFMVFEVSLQIIPFMRAFV